MPLKYPTLQDAFFGKTLSQEEWCIEEKMEEETENDTFSNHQEMATKAQERCSRSKHFGQNVNVHDAKKK